MKEKILTEINDCCELEESSEDVDEAESEVDIQGLDSRHVGQFGVGGSNQSDQTEHCGDGQARTARNTLSVDPKRHLNKKQL